jgi:hypothetical protein
MWHNTGGGQRHMGAMCTLMELCELYWGVGQMGRDIPAHDAQVTVKNEWCQPS